MSPSLCGGGISAWYIRKRRHLKTFLLSFKIAFAAAIITAPMQDYPGDGSVRIMILPGFALVFIMLWTVRVWYKKELSEAVLEIEE